MKKLNKRGADKVISVYWFVILFIVAAAVAYMVFAFYGKPYDIRELEANSLINKIASCISNGGYIKEASLTQEFKQNFLAECKITFNVEDTFGWKEEEQYYLETEIIDFSSKNKISQITAGNSNLKTFCDAHGEKLPFCVKRSFYTIDKANKQYQVDILSIVRKTEKNVQ